MVRSLFFSAVILCFVPMYLGCGDGGSYVVEDPSPQLGEADTTPAADPVDE